MNKVHRSIRRTLGIALVAVALGAGCGGSGDEGTADAGGDTPDARVDRVDPDHGRVVVLGEEFLLADVLALGVDVVSSTATLADQGFLGMEGLDVEGIEALPATDPNRELLAAQHADLIIAPQYVVDELGRDVVEGATDRLIVLEDRPSAEDQIRTLGEELDRTDEADELLADLEAARDDAAGEVPDDCVVSAATIYPGPAPAIYVTGDATVPAALVDLGCTLTPSADGLDPDQLGRVYVSLEELGMLDGPRLVLIQNEAVEGEGESLAEIESSPLWEGLPAVEAGAVVTIDRLGYPGIVGQTRLYDDLVAALG